MLKKAVELHTNENRWNIAQKNGFDLIQKLYHRQTNAQALIDRLLEVKNKCQELRNLNLIGAMLSHHQHRSTRYFSKWIEEKNKKGQV